jgi:methylated-DNA-[protein]-cysteine S-methyltransferase
MNEMKRFCRAPSPLGEILLVSNARGDALCGLYLAGQKYFPERTGAWEEAPRLPLFRTATRELGEYFAGKRTAFDVPLAPEGTAFQRDVWSAIRGVPFGGTMTYAELARRCGRPSAVRAVGAATGRNPLTVVVPCHRIVGSGGALTGYAGGLPRKRALLDLESRHALDDVRNVA